MGTGACGGAVSSYFDTKSAQLYAMNAARGTPYDPHIRAWVDEVVSDIALCLTFERATDMAFPADLADKACRIIMRGSADHWPCGVPQAPWGADYDSDEDGMRILAKMIEDLHDLFHETARRGWVGGDNPRAPHIYASARLEERCAALAGVP